MRTFSGTYELQDMLTRGGNPSGSHHKLFVHNEGVYLFSYGIPVEVTGPGRVPRSRLGQQQHNEEVRHYVSRG